MYHGSVLHVRELDCIRNRWAIISELYFTGIAVEQPIIRHAEGSTIELNALQVTKHCSVQNCCLDGGCTGTPGRRYFDIGLFDETYSTSVTVFVTLFHTTVIY